MLEVFSLLPLPPFSWPPPGVPPPPTPMAHLPAPLLLQCAGLPGPCRPEPWTPVVTIPVCCPSPLTGVCGPGPTVGLVTVWPLWASPTEAPLWEVPAGCWLSPGRLSQSWSQVFNGDRKRGREEGPRNWSSSDCWEPIQTWGCSSPRGSQLSPTKNSLRLGQVCQGLVVLPVGSGGRRGQL